jgi:ADP-ribosylglycohydrolase
MGKPNKHGVDENGCIVEHGFFGELGDDFEPEPEEDCEDEEVKEQIRETERYLDKIRGCFIGGAIGDALGYPVEFMHEDQIFSKYGDNGITEYELNRSTGKALISDDTQMTLFTANGLLVGDTRGALRGIQAPPRQYVIKSYFDWLKTQNSTFESRLKNDSREYENRIASWLMDVPELFSCRAPGNTCLSALHSRQSGDGYEDSYIQSTLNNSKGCGGIMRIAPLALNYPHVDIEQLDMEGAEIAAITHSHSLGYMPAAVLTHIINRIVFAEEKTDLKEIVLEAKDTIAKLFRGDKHLKELTDIINLAVNLSQNDEGDLDNIHRIGEGWVAEETLGIAVYCALKYQNSFSKGVIVAVNHNGDSDSTGAVTGNILGALLGYDAIEEKWKKNLELIDVITEMADDICHGCQMSEYNSYRDPDWIRKYIYMHWREEDND